MTIYLNTISSFDRTSLQMYTIACKFLDLFRNGTVNFLREIVWGFFTGPIIFALAAVTVVVCFIVALRFGGKGTGQVALSNILGAVTSMVIYGILCSTISTLVLPLVLLVVLVSFVLVGFKHLTSRQAKQIAELEEKKGQSEDLTSRQAKQIAELLEQKVQSEDPTSALAKEIAELNKRIEALQHASPAPVVQAQPSPAPVVQPQRVFRSSIVFALLCITWQLWLLYVDVQTFHKDVTAMMKQ
jgi:hypothetical protein